MCVFEFNYISISTITGVIFIEPQETGGTLSSRGVVKQFNSGPVIVDRDAKFGNSAGAPAPPIFLNICCLFPWPGLSW